MRFIQLDRITLLEPGVRIEAVKCLSLAEEYLQDHFPRFPVMPGVLMLEAMFQASMWLVRASEDFAHAVVVLKEARNVRFADFVQPGETLRVEAAILKQDASTTTLKAQGLVDDVLAVNARLVLERYNMADRLPERAPSDPRARRDMRRVFELLFPDGAPESVH
ncbi:MAG: beta-hydroxyacyl-ACP dehydratase [Pirellulaceae bacterium]|nr:beta-hydroxyacyl-ACP dehydratase [Pirellulaceae bacterium]